MRSLIERLTKLFASTGAPPTGSTTPTTSVSADDPRIPEGLRPRVVRLLAVVAEIDARAAVDPLVAPAATELHLLRDQHLPRLIESYAAIPATHRAEIFRQTGRSASYNLGEALDLLIAKADAEATTVARDNLDDFTNTLRFIGERYGRGDPLG